MFTYRRNITPHAAEYLRSKEASEAAGNFLLYLGHTQVTFRGIIVKGYIEIIHKCQCFIRMVCQAIKQIAGRALLFSAAPFPTL